MAVLWFFLNGVILTNYKSWADPPSRGMKSTRPEPGAVIGLPPWTWVLWFCFVWKKNEKTPETYDFEPKRLEVDGRCFHFQFGTIFIFHLNFQGCNWCNIASYIDIPGSSKCVTCVPIFTRKTCKKGRNFAYVFWGFFFEHHQPAGTFESMTFLLPRWDSLSSLEGNLLKAVNFLCYPGLPNTKAEEGSFGAQKDIPSKYRSPQEDVSLED